VVVKTYYYVENAKTKDYLLEYQRLAKLNTGDDGPLFADEAGLLWDCLSASVRQGDHSELHSFIMDDETAEAVIAGKFMSLTVSYRVEFWNPIGRVISPVRAKFE